jgi:hypothetical protein
MSTRSSLQKDLRNALRPPESGHSHTWGIITSVGRLTSAWDMGQGTSQHLTFGESASFTVVKCWDVPCPMSHALVKRPADHSRAALTEEGVTRFSQRLSEGGLS